MTPTIFKRATFLVCAFLVCLADAVRAQVPQLIRYEGRIASGGVSFDGSGQFKFALVNGAGTVTFWSNDGTSAAGSQPTAAVSLAVTGGHYSVLLGDTALANMTTLPASVFDNGDVRLRVWFNDGTSGSQLLTPDQRITPAAFAMLAGDVGAGAITNAKIAAGAVGSAALADGSVAAADIAAGSVNATNLADGAVAGSLAAAGMSGVAAGGVILAERETAELREAGYVRIGTFRTGGGWERLSSGYAPSDRSDHVAVWTGTEMIVWGGSDLFNGTKTQSGGRYNPATNAWVPTNTTGAPAGRTSFHAVWTGTEMIVWGGAGSSGTAINTGGRYNPATDSWLSTTTTGAAAARFSHCAVWTGAEMLIWGGRSDRSGRKYDPVTDSWTAMTTTNAPADRQNAGFVWTGTEMIVWGGNVVGEGFSPSGGRYNPGTNTWTATSTVGVPPLRYSTTAVWTGTEMLIWGGSTGGGVGGTVNTGGKYNPTTDSWATITTTGAPSQRQQHTAVWTGSRMVVWGGAEASVSYGDGGIYDPVADTWTPTSATSAPRAMFNHVAVWTGDEMIVWGHSNGTATTTSGVGGRYDLASHSWRDLPVAGPIPRREHGAVWTGREMIVWGGTGGGGVSSSGGRYDAATDAWRYMEGNGGLARGYGFTPLWTGAEMILWGGHTGTLPAGGNEGARYNPATNAWTAMSTTGAPAARNYHCTVWTGTQMIVWGGILNGGSTATETGGRYFPASDSWAETDVTSAPTARVWAASAWTGTEMLVWGGSGNGAPFRQNTGSRYNPSTNSWTAMTTTGAPSARAEHSGVWTGTRFIVWGGLGESGPPVNTGAIYDPGANSWTAMTPTNAPAGRYWHTATWDGSAMIVWGGRTATSTLTFTNEGGAYSPATNAWTALPLTNAPTARYNHSAVWTGSELLIYGGETGTAFGSSELWKLGSPRTLILFAKP